MGRRLLFKQPPPKTVQLRGVCRTQSKYNAELPPEVRANPKLRRRWLQKKYELSRTRRSGHRIQHEASCGGRVIGQAQRLEVAPGPYPAGYSDPYGRPAEADDEGEIDVNRSEAEPIQHSPPVIADEEGEFDANWSDAEPIQHSPPVIADDEGEFDANRSDAGPIQHSSSAQWLADLKTDLTRQIHSPRVRNAVGANVLNLLMNEEALFLYFNYAEKIYSTLASVES